MRLDFARGRVYIQVAIIPASPKRFPDRLAHHIPAERERNVADAAG